MKTYSILFIFVLFLSCTPKEPTPSDSINPIIGDQSYLEKFGTLPNDQTNEDIRIATHLDYAAKILQNRDASHLSPDLQKRRADNIAFLQEYIQQGIFPRNYDYKDQRKPCFIDRDGRICAVGYLVERSASRTLAEQINVMHQYDEIEEMDSEMVTEWVAESGLTREEVAMIQPTYYTSGVVHFSRQSLVYSGINVGFLTLNSIDLFNRRKRVWASIAGITTGALQVYSGFNNIPGEIERDYLANYYEEYLIQKQRYIAANIAVGTTTLLVSASGLIFNRKRKNKNISWNLYGAPQFDHTFEMGFHFSRRF